MTAQFLVDAMLGTLATYLRMCGHDAAFVLDDSVEADEEIRRWARADGRTLLTSDRSLADRTDETILVEGREIETQLAELAAAGVALSLAETPARCGACNAELKGVGPGEGTPGYAPDPTEVAVWRCRACGQHFWRDDVAETIEAAT